MIFTLVVQPSFQLGLTLSMVETSLMSHGFYIFCASQQCLHIRRLHDTDQ